MTWPATRNPHHNSISKDMSERSFVPPDLLVVRGRARGDRASLATRLRAAPTVKQLQLSTVRSAATTHWALTDKNLETRIVF